MEPLRLLAAWMLLSLVVGPLVGERLRRCGR